MPIIPASNGQDVGVRVLRETGRERVASWTVPQVGLQDRGTNSQEENARKWVDEEKTGVDRSPVGSTVDVTDWSA